MQIYWVLKPVGPAVCLAWCGMYAYASWKLVTFWKVCSLFIWFWLQRETFWVSQWEACLLLYVSYLAFCSEFHTLHQALQISASFGTCIWTQQSRSSLLKTELSSHSNLSPSLGRLWLQSFYSLLFFSMFEDAYRLVLLLCMFGYLCEQLHHVLVILMQPESWHWRCLCSCVVNRWS